LRSRSLSPSRFGAAVITESLSHDEQDQVTKFYPLLQKIAAIVAPRNQDEAISDGFAGLVDGLRTYDLSRGASLETYLTSRIRWAIQDGLRRERSRRMHSLDSLAEDGFDIEDRRGAVDADVDEMLEAIDERLPLHLATLVLKYISVGNIDETAKELGLPRFKARKGLALAKQILKKRR